MLLKRKVGFFISFSLSPKLKYGEGESLIHIDIPFSLRLFFLTQLGLEPKREPHRHGRQPTQEGRKWERCPTGKKKAHTSEKRWRTQGSNPRQPLELPPLTSKINGHPPSSLPLNLYDRRYIEVKLWPTHTWISWFSMYTFS